MFSRQVQVFADNLMVHKIVTSINNSYIDLNKCLLGSLKHAVSVSGEGVEGSSRYRHWLEGIVENREMKPIQVTRSLGQEFKQKSPN